MSSYPPVRPENGYKFAQSHSESYAAINPATKSDCSGLAVLITGASRGVGHATALSYAAAGASHLILTARSDLSALKIDVEARSKASGRRTPQVLTLAMDVESLASVEQAAQVVAAQVGRLDILYNNAGYLEEFVPVADSDPLEWWRTWSVNLRGVYHCARTFLPLLLRTPGGAKTIVNTSSIGAHGLRRGASAYQTSKLAVLKFTEFLAAEYTCQGLLAFAVHPGGILTDLAARTPREMHDVLVDRPEVAGDALAYLTQTRREWLAGRYISLTWDVPELLIREEEIIRGDKLKVRLVV